MHVQKTDGTSMVQICTTFVKNYCVYLKCEIMLKVSVVVEFAEQIILELSIRQ